VSDPGPAIARFDFTSGLLRGSHLTLFPACVVHRGDAALETLPLAAIASVHVAFERDSRQLGWGVALILVALLLLAIAAPLAVFAGAQAAEMAAAGSQGVAHALQSFFGLLEFAANLLPALAVLTAVGGIALAAFGWLGNTRLTLSFGGFERVFPARSRNTRLLDFAELLAEQLMTLKR
jgi:hypothetical protein